MATTTEVVADPLEPDTINVPEVLKGDTWLRHHREDLMPYWDMPEAYGDPVGNFPSFRDRSGHLDPANPNRGLSTLARNVYGYSVAFMLTGEERYLTYAKAGIDWINTKAKDPVYGGYYGELKADGTPANPLGNKDVFDLGSLGLAYGMYFNVTRDPAAEQDLLAVRDLLFDKYYDAANNRVKDSLSYDLSTEVDTNGNGGDITNYLVPVTAMYLFNTPLLTDPARRAQFRNDIRLLTQGLIDHHKSPATSANPWWFWGRTARFGNFNALQTDFGHNIKSYEMIYNADQMFPDHPWASLTADRTTLLNRAWDDAASRWNQKLRNFQLGNVEPDSSWWMHDEADQTLAAMDINEGTTPTRLDQLARSAQTWLDVYVDHDPAYPVRETFFRVARNGTDTDLRKSGFGKNMDHAHEHALIMYLHGRDLEGKPAKLYYAFPADQALTAVAKPYWFDATNEYREVTGDVSVLPGHKVVEVSFSGIGDVPDAPYPAPDDTTAPATVATVSPTPTAAGWNRDDVTVSFQATDDIVGVKEIHVRVEDDIAATPPVAYIDPGGTFTLPALTAEGEYDVTYSAVDALGNTEQPQTLEVKVDRTDPVVTCQPEPAFELGQTGQVSATVADAMSGPAAPLVTAEADTSSVGSAAASVTGADLAGRTATASCGYQVRYGFIGFEAPVDNGVVNVAKAGTATPLKWRLTDHAGNPVLDLASVRITSAGHTCDGGAVEDPIEEVASGASGLQNLGDGNYQINWKSPKTYAGTCRTLQLDLGEGQQRTAEFRFKA